MAARRNPVIAIEIDLWDGSRVRTLRLSNFGPITREITSGVEPGISASLAGFSAADFDAAMRAVVEESR